MASTVGQTNSRREAGMLVIGALVGGLFGIIGNLWSAYFVEWLKNTFPNSDWTISVVISSILLVLTITFLFVWARKQLRS